MKARVISLRTLCLARRMVRQEAKTEPDSNTGELNVHKHGLQVHYNMAVYPHEQRPILFACRTPSTAAFFISSIVLFSFCILPFFSPL
jgi:hypothetical protein